jgi:hypothetical protein
MQRREADDTMDACVLPDATAATAKKHFMRADAITATPS